MKKLKTLVRLLPVFLFGFMAVVALNSCGDDEEEDEVTPIVDPSDDNDDNDNDDADDQQEEASARTLNVEIDMDLSGSTQSYNGVKKGENAEGTVSVVIDDMPQSVAEIKKLKLPKGIDNIHESPYLQPVLILAALNQMNYSKERAQDMLDYICRITKSENVDGELVHYPDNSEDITEYYSSDWYQMQQYKKYSKILSYLDGATSKTNYVPASKPYTMTLKLTSYSYSFVDPDWMSIKCTTSQASSPRSLEVWMQDTDYDGVYDKFWTNKYLPLCVGVFEY